jgi:hypothetical protein
MGNGQYIKLSDEGGALKLTNDLNDPSTYFLLHPLDEVI